MIKIFLFFSIFLCYTTDLIAQWSYKGLGGIVVHQLTIDNDTVYASTANGLYKKEINSPDTTWQLVSFPGKSVLNTMFLDQNTCLVLVSIDPVFHKAQLYKSNNRGVTSTLFLPDTVYYGYPNLNHIARSPHSNDTIYLKDHGLKTFNGGISWQQLASIPTGGNFIYVNPGNSKEVFLGGENMIFSATLHRSGDNGQSWVNEDCSSYFAGDNALEVMHCVNGDWYASGEGIVAKRPAGSTSWTQLLNVFSDQVWGMYFFGFAFSPVNSNYMYVSGDRYDNDQLKLIKSSTQGALWDSISYTMSGMTRYATYDLKVQRVGTNDRVWLGGYGVFTFTQPVPLSIDDKTNAAALKVYPNPASDVVNIDLSGRKENFDITIRNSIGQVLYQGSADGGKTKKILTKGWGSGLYFLEARTYQTNDLLRFIIQ
jgi:hypothetical protein